MRLRASGSTTVFASSANADTSGGGIACFGQSVTKSSGVRLILCVCGSFRSYRRVQFSFSLYSRRHPTRTQSPRLMSTSRSTSSPHFDAGSDGLLPVIAQDLASGRVLMMAWMNQEAYEETLRTRQACYYSRSRKSLWRKGETSGHRQRVVRVQFDCDADCILIQVEQIGAACHDGYASCFYRTVQDDLSVTIDEPRLVDPAVVYNSKAE